MATIFGTSSEDECQHKNSKPPTPNSNGNKATSAINIQAKCPKLNVDQVFSDSSTEKLEDSPALMSDSDDDVPSRPPPPSFTESKQEDNKSDKPDNNTREVLP